jgi:hypothetical protein
MRGAGSPTCIGDQDRGRQTHAIRGVAVKLGGWDQRLLELHAVALAGASQRCRHNQEHKTERGKTNDAHGPPSRRAVSAAGTWYRSNVLRPRSHGAFHREPFGNARRPVICARDFQNGSGCSKSNQRDSSPFARVPRKTVVSKWYPQLSQVHKCRTHRSFTCSDQSGAINISPHCAQGLKYLGWAGRALVAVSRDILKPPKIAAPIRGGP